MSTSEQEMETFEKSFGEIMKETRKQLGMTQKEVAGILGVTHAHISNAEKGGHVSGHFKKLFERTFQSTEGGRAEIETESPAPKETAAHSMAEDILFEEIQTARSELGRPMLDIEIEAWKAAPGNELISESILLREALELRSTRELLAGAQAFRKKREASRKGGGRLC